MQVAPGATYEAVIDWGQTGLTLGLRVIDNAGATTVARLATNITEYPAGSGIYSRTGNTAPAVAGQYTLVWDDDAGVGAIGHVATEDLLVTSTPLYAAPSGTAYVSAATLKVTLSLSGETFADADLAVAVEAASRMIDQACDRRFYLDAAATNIRYYTPQSAKVVAIDDLVTLTTFATDTSNSGTYTTQTLNTDFTLEPLNAAADSWPYTRAVAHPSSATGFPSTYPRSVKVTGQFGWPAVPAAIVQATTILAARLMKRAREAPLGVAGFGIDGNVVRVPRIDPDVEALIQPYKRLGT